MGGIAAILGLLSCSGSPTPSAAEPVQAPVAAATKDASAPTTNENSSATKPNLPSLESKDSKAVAKTLVKVSELRGVAAVRSVPGVKLDRNELVAAVKEKALREYPPEALRREGQTLQLMGFAPASFDYLGEMMKLLEAQLEGFYEPKNGTMYLAADLHGPEAQATLAHELVHALQDQRWDLKSRSVYKPGRGDETMATACLAEGDATSLMLDFLMKPQKSALDMPDNALQELMRSGVNTGDVKTVPHILRTSLLAPYVEGLGFIHGLRRKGGWALVDKAWEKVPTTTEQILHLDKWEAAEPALSVVAPPGRTLGEGWTMNDEDTFGELGLALTFAEWMDTSDARIAASGWGGDRTSTWTKGDEIAYAVHLRYDPATDKAKGQSDARYAERAMSKILPALKKKLGNPSFADASSICFDRKETGPLLFARKDRDVVLLAGPAKASGANWSSTATCATAKTWATEVLK
ncbi:hypothetical protein AKJ09_03480 [Labilithrix luteola]|uniref:Lipoprotein n=1 Tax=Labilithrix luteola TaxID=1391654 RepID=A0A0K1PTX8_9BACT|nr:hypothetical protein AKJ09_03480 [Labilithrix luteola]